MTEMFRRGFVVLVASAVFAVAGGAAASPQGDDQAALAAALKSVTVSLEQGLLASAARGTAISAKFELDDGKVQLSVYTMKGGKFSEVIIAHTTGKIAKSEPITSADDLGAAKSQGAAVSKAKRSLRAAVARAVKANSGSRAVSVVATLQGGRPVATITLLSGQTFQTVSEPLD